MPQRDSSRHVGAPLARLGPRPRSFHRLRTRHAYRRRIARRVVAGTQFAASMRSGPARGRAIDIKEDPTVMRSLKAVTALTLIALISVVLAACTSTTGKTASENVDGGSLE